MGRMFLEGVKDASLARMSEMIIMDCRRKGARRIGRQTELVRRAPAGVHVLAV